MKAELNQCLQPAATQAAAPLGKLNMFNEVREVQPVSSSTTTSAMVYQSVVPSDQSTWVCQHDGCVCALSVHRVALG